MRAEGGLARMGSADAHPRSRYSTSTVLENGTILPWLAASGPLAYTPESPPLSNYWFQYSWVLPGIFAPATNRRRHHYFGEQWRDYARELFRFWELAREGRTDRIAGSVGGLRGSGIAAPIAVYHMKDALDRELYVLIQHGSYQVVPVEHQPRLANGEVTLYRGIEQAPTFRFPNLGAATLMASAPAIWQSYARAQLRMLSDSVISFNTIHDRAVRCETTHILDRSWLADKIVGQEGMNLAEGPGAALWRAACESFTLVRWVAENKFGPNYVVGKTPIDNVRSTTFFAGEHEIRVLDPKRFEICETHGCREQRSSA